MDDLETKLALQAAAINDQQETIEKLAERVLALSVYQQTANDAIRSQIYAIHNELLNLKQGPRGGW